MPELLARTAAAAILICLLSGKPARAGRAAPEGPDWRAIDGYIRAEMEMNEIPGLALAVVRGKEAKTRAYGVKSLVTGEPLTADTPVELASVSKSFTALAVMQLVQSGRVLLDRPVSTYLPEFRARGEWARITVRHLLRHTSGFSRQDDFLMPCCGHRGEFDLGLAVRSLSGARLRWPPGARFRYANSNYVVLAALIGRVSGVRFPAYMEEYVLRPLGMTRTTIDRDTARAWGLAAPHERQWGRVRPSPSRFSGWYGASEVKSTATDMARYLAAALSGPPHQAPYEMGWFVYPRAEWLGGTRIVEHTGAIWGGNTAAVLVPEHGLAVAVLTNAGQERAGPIARGILARMLGLRAPAPGRVRWANSPDFWATCFLVAAVVITAATAAYIAQALRQHRRGERRFTRPGAWAIARAILLASMAACLAGLVLGAGGPPLASYPATVKLALPPLAAATAALLLSTAVIGLTARR